MKDPNQFLTFLLLCTAFIFAAFILFFLSQPKIYHLSPIPIENIYQNKVVYGHNLLSPDQLKLIKQDCQKRSGKFNSCGWVCDMTKSETCVTVCAYTCELNSHTTGQFCGGIAGLPCPTGFTCKLDGSYPDAGGVCIKSPQ